MAVVLEVRRRFVVMEGVDFHDFFRISWWLQLLGFPRS